MKGPPNKRPQKKGFPGKEHHRYQKPIKQVKQNKFSEIGGLVIIILLGIIIYSNSFECSFHFDDYRSIIENTSIRNLADVKSWWNFSPSRPIGTFTFALNYHFSKLDVFSYHLVNLIIHLINACLVWWLTLLIFSSPSLKDIAIVRHKKVLAFITALLFVSHPLATQSITYIVQRLASLVTMFYLLSIALYMKARLSNKGNIFKTLFFGGALISALLAMLTKENAFTLPFAILLFEFFFLKTKKFSINFRDYRVILLIAALLGIIIIIPLKFSFSIFKPLPPSLGNAYTITPFNYFFTQFSVILKYIQLLFLPLNQHLDYDFPISNTFFEIRTLLSFLVLSALIILAIFSFRRYRIISFGIFWFFLTLSIESSIIPINDVIYEHRTYLPSFGFFLILSSGIYLLLWNKYKYLAISIFVIIIASNSWLTYERNKVWKDELSLWDDNVAKTPDLPRALLNRGTAYGNLGQWDKAIADYSKTIEVDPEYPEGYYNRGYSYGSLGQYDKAIADYSMAIKLDPTSTKAWSNRGLAYANLGQLEKAITDFSRVIELDPDQAAMYSDRGLAYATLGQTDKALNDYSKAIGLDPNFAKAYNNRGILYNRLGQWDKAISDFSIALQIDPGYTQAYNNREFAYKNLNSNKK